MNTKRFKEYFYFLKTLFKTNIKLLIGMWKLTKIQQPAITIFGSARAKPDSIICKQAKQLSNLLANAEFSIITGGGPGIMNAANQGAFEHLKAYHPEAFLNETEIISAGIGLIRLNKEKENPFIQEYIETDHFFARKWLLVRYSVGFVIFPGGFGTLDELLEIMTLVQCNRMARVPILLIDSSYWNPLLEWIQNKIFTEGFIDKQDMFIIKILDDVNEAAEILIDCCGQTKRSVLHKDTEFRE